MQFQNERPPLFSFTEEATLTYDGPGEVEFLENPNENEYTVSITTHGIYYFTAEVEYQSETYTDTVAIQVLSEAELDILLRAKWEGMKTALSDGNIGEATNFTAKGTREMYEYNFNLISSYLGEISAGLQDIALLRIEGRIAEYEMWAEQDGQTYSFYILFVKGSDGIWRIQFF